MGSEMLSNPLSSLTTNFPDSPSPPYRNHKLLPKPVLEHRLPRHQAEPAGVIQHGVPPASEHEATPVDAGYALPIGYRSMLQAGFGSNVLRGPHKLALA